MTDQTPEPDDLDHDEGVPADLLELHEAMEMHAAIEVAQAETDWADMQEEGTD